MNSTPLQAEPAATTAEQPRLQRNALNLFGTIAGTLANLAPAEGIFLSLGLVVATMGSRAPWAFLIATVAVLTLGNTMSEFSRVRPSAGSFIAYIGSSLQGYAPRFALFTSTTCFVLLLLGGPITVAAVVVFLGSWVNALIPSLNWMLVAVVSVVVTMPLLLRGVRILSLWAFLFFLIEGIGLLLLSVVIFFLASGHLGDPLTNLGGMPGLGGLALAFPIAISGFIGWENSGALAEETRNPRRTIPITIFVSILIIGLIYFISSYAAVIGFAGIPAKDTMGNLAIDPAPYLTLAQHYIPWFSVIVGIVGVTSSVGCFLAAANSQTRIVFNSARDGLLPAFFARVRKGSRPVPYNSVLLYVGLMLVLIIVPGIWITPVNLFAYEATIGTVAIVLIYLLANLALPLYFWKHLRAEFNWFRHVVVPLLGVGVLALPIWGFFAPGQTAPYNYFGWIFLAMVVLSAAWATYIVLARPQAALRLGAVVADE